MADNVKEQAPDAKHMALRAACMSLRKYAYDLSIRPKATIRADELYGRLDDALYPKTEERRREPLDGLLDAARRDEVSGHVSALETALLETRSIARDMERARGGELVALQRRVTGVADGLASFLNGSDFPTPS